jgi:NAD(P)-dependent dehydrogenase (short-subunit alcohol dehydrogenase family)
MRLPLKPVAEQVIVITGASSGIGLATAKLAAERGAKVVLAARTREALGQAVDQIKYAGGEAIFVEADVSRERTTTRSPPPPSSASAASIPGSTMPASVSGR